MTSPDLHKAASDRKQLDRAAYLRNREKILARNRKYYLRNRDKILAYQKSYRDAHRTTRAKYERDRHTLDMDFKLTKNLRHRITHALRGATKSARTKELLGCTVEEFKQHLESLFKPGMSWDNYGFEGWHIDHIRPCAVFDLTDPEQQRACFHYTNLQPLWAAENLRKGATSV